MKRILSIMLVGMLVLGVGAWLKRDDILLAIIKIRSANAYDDVAEKTPVLPWGKGPEARLENADQQPPNIILIVADDLGINDISTFGGGIDGGRLKTPNIDRLAKEGVAFTQSYSGASSCAPSRAMMMTGRYPTRTGFEYTPAPSGFGKMVSRIMNNMDNGLPPAIYDGALEESQPPYVSKGLPPEEVTIAEVLKAHGYYTAHIGKWHLGRSNGMEPHKQGFDDSLLMAGNLYLPEDDPDVVNARLSFDPIDKFLWASANYAGSFNSGDEKRFRPGGYLTDYWTDEAINVIKAYKNRPFFLYLAHWGPHTPLQSTREDYEAVGDITPHRKRVYAGMIRAVDRSVGRVLNALDAEGLSENTIVVFTSDNGGAGYIGIPDVNKPFRGWKITMFEGGIRVPMLARWPAQIPAGLKVDTPVAHIDVMPTLAAAAGALNPKGVAIDGRNILELTTEEGQAVWDRKTLFWQSGHYQVVRHGDWKLQVNDRPVGGPKKWLFDLAGDPTEQTNLAESEPEMLEKLSNLLAEHQASSRGPLYASTTQLPVMVDKTLAERFEDGDEYIYTPN
jgi:uncharacterized sulfatase